MFSKIFSKAKRILSEPSSWGTVGMIAVYLGLRPDDAALLVDAAIVIAGYLGLTLKEKASSKG